MLSLNKMLQIFVAASLFAVSIQGQSILSKMKSIHLLQASRSDVEAAFGKPPIIYSFGSPSPTHVEYKVRSGTLTAFYSPGLCSEAKRSTYDVPTGTVTSLEFDFGEGIHFRSQVLDLLKFHREEIYDIPGNFEYRNLETGEYYLVYEIGTQQRLRKITLTPPQKLDSKECR